MVHELCIGIIAGSVLSIAVYLAKISAVIDALYIQWRCCSELAKKDKQDAA